MIFNTRDLRAAALVSAVIFSPIIAVVGCTPTVPGQTAGQVTPAQVATWIKAEADGLRVAAAALPNVPPSVTQALADLSAIAGSVSSSDLPSQGTLNRVQADVEGVLQVIQPILPPAYQAYASAAAVLLPWIVQAIEAPHALTARTYAAAARQPMSRDQAVGVLMAKAPVK